MSERTSDIVRKWWQDAVSKAREFMSPDKLYNGGRIYLSSGGREKIK